MDDAAFVTVRGLTKRYGARTVVASVDVDVREGEFLSLLGPSGSGKTTVLRMIAGLTRPDGGTIRIGGQSVFDGRKEIPPEERNLGMVFQDYALWPHMTVARNIAFGLRLRRMPREQVRARVREMLALVDLAGIEDRYPNQLSGGQQQRVALARALANRPRLLLLDEPLSSLDTGLREVMREELQRIVRATRMTVINVTHDQDEAMFLSDRIVLLRNGAVQQSGPPADLYHRPRSAFVGHFMGPANVLTGVVASVAGSLATIQVGDLVVRGSTGAREVRPGAVQAILCRPEDVVLHETPPGGEVNSYHGTIARGAFAGGRWRLHVAVAPGVDILVLTAQVSRTQGDVWLTLPPERCLVVEPDDLAMSELDAPPAETTTKDQTAAIGGIA